MLLEVGSLISPEHSRFVLEIVIIARYPVIILERFNEIAIINNYSRGMFTQTFKKRETQCLFPISFYHN